MLDVLEITEEKTTDDDDSLNHYVCIDCYPAPDIHNKGLCGSVVNDTVECTEEEVNCVVCLDIKYCPIDHGCTC